MVDVCELCYLCDSIRAFCFDLRCPTIMRAGVAEELRVLLQRLSKVRRSDALLFRPRRCPVSSGRPPGPASSRPHMQLHRAWKLTYVAPSVPAPVVAVPSPQPADQGQRRQGPTCKCTEPRADFVATRVDGTSTHLNPHEKGTKDATPTVVRLAHGIQQDQVPHRLLPLVQTPSLVAGADFAYEQLGMADRKSVV